MSSSINIYDQSVKSSSGTTVNLSDYKGKVLLIVNVASKCGYTPQYSALEKLYKKYQGKLVIIGFPANNFGAQEPGTNGEIQEFCLKNYGVSFPMAAKISVKGENIAPLYLWLTKKEYNNFQDTEVKWNFQKYLIDRAGRVIKSYPANVSPEDLFLKVDLEAALKAQP